MILLPANRTLLLFTFCLISRLNAQFLIPVTDIPVFANSEFYSHPWVGGLNQVQPSLIDFDQDGLPELMLYDRQGRFPVIMEREGNEWIWRPALSRNFPVAGGWMRAVYADCDSWPDLLMSSPNDGVVLWRGTGPYSWEVQGTIATTIDGPVYVLEDDIPAIGDVNGDGRLDLLAFNAPGSQVQWYALAGKCDSLFWRLENGCWGEFAEGGLSSDIFLNTSCLTSTGNAGTHNGLHAGSSLALADIDGDGLQDLVLGDLNTNNLVYLHNGGVPAFASMDGVVNNFPAGQPVNLRRFVAPFFLDLDLDGDLDLLAVPNDLAEGRNVNQLWRYENTSAGAMVLEKRQEDWLVGGMIDVGERSNPAFVDVNADGLPDMVLGQAGFRDSNGQGRSGLFLYLNTGTAESPSFDLLNDNWLNLPALFNPPISALRPAFADVDIDGDQDMVLGDRNGQMHLFLNAANPGASPLFVLVAANWLSLDVGEYAAPAFGDLNGDGRPDLIVGNAAGTLTLLQNLSLQGSIAFSAPDSQAGGIDLGLCCGGHSVPALWERNLQQWEMVIGTESGYLLRYNNLSLTPGQPFVLVDSAFGNVPPVPGASPVAVSLNTGTQPMWFLGTKAGGVRVFDESATNSLATDLGLHRWRWQVKDGSLTIRRAPGSSHERGSCRLFNLQGQLIGQIDIPAGSLSADLPVGAYGPGVYLLDILEKEARQIEKIWVQE